MKNFLKSAALSLAVVATSAAAEETPHKKFHLYNTEANITSTPNGASDFAQAGKGVWDTNYGPQKKKYDRACQGKADVITIKGGIVHTSCAQIAPGTGGSCTISVKQNTSLETGPVGTKVTGEIDCPGMNAQPIDIKLGAKEFKTMGIRIVNPVGGGATATTFPLQPSHYTATPSLNLLTLGLKN